MASIKDRRISNGTSRLQGAGLDRAYDSGPPVDLAFRQALDAFMDHLRYERSRSDETINAKFYACRNIAAACNGTLIGASKQALSRALTKRQVCDSTRGDYIAHLRTFYEWAIDEGLTDVNPAARMVKPSKPRRRPLPLNDGEWAKVVHMANYKQPLRLWLMLEAYAGLRSCSVAAMQAQDIDWDADKLHIRGKGAHDYTVPLHPLLRAELERLVFIDEGPLFLGRDGGQISADTVADSINRHLKRCGLTKTAHKLRHRFGTSVYDASDILTAQQCLGHKSLTSTQVYVDWNDDKVRSAIEGLK